MGTGPGGRGVELHAEKSSRVTRPDQYAKDLPRIARGRAIAGHSHAIARIGSQQGLRVLRNANAVFNLLPLRRMPGPLALTWQQSLLRAPLRQIIVRYACTRYQEVKVFKSDSRAGGPWLIRLQ